MVSYIKLAEQMKEDGITVTPTMVRYVWQRHGLSTRAARLQWVRKKNGGRNGTKTKGAENSLEVGPAVCASATALPSAVPLTTAAAGKIAGPYNQRVR